MTPQTSYKRAIGVGLVLGIVLGFSAFASIRCGKNSPTASSEVSSDIPTEETFSPTPGSSTPTPGAQPTPPTPGRCEVINIHRRDVTVTTDGLKVTMLVPVSYDGPGNVFVYVWLPEVNNGIEKGPFSPNQEFSFTVSEFKTYQYQLAVEVDLDGDKRADQNLQCDNHRDNFTTRKPPCTNCDEPKCEEPNININGVCGPICDDGPPQIDLRASTATGQITTEDACHPFCTVNPDHPFCQPKECEFGERFWNGQQWECPTCDDVTKPQITSLSGSGTVNESLSCKNIGLCGSNGQNCNIVAGNCRGKFSNTNYGSAKTVYSRVNPFTCNMTFTGPGTFKLILRAANPGNYAKRIVEKTVACQTQGSLETSYNWAGHNSEDWNCEGYINNTLTEESNVVDGH